MKRNPSNRPGHRAVSHTGRRLAVATLLTALSILGINAQTWDGSSSANWSTGANWTGDTAPGANAAVIFNDPVAGNPANTLDATFILNTLTYGPLQTVTVTTTTTTTNNSLIFNPGNIVSVSAGTHYIVGPGAGGNSIGAIGFTNNLSNVPAPALAIASSGNQLTFSWSGASYTLQVQTNSLTGTWSDYPGGEVSPVTVTLNPSASAVFYRLASVWPFYTFDVASGASLEIAGRMRRMTNVVLNPTNYAHSYFKSGGGTLYLSKDNGGGLGWMNGGDMFTVNQGILKLDDKARGNSGMRLVVKKGASLQVLGTQAVPGGYVQLAGDGVAGGGAVEFVGGLNISLSGTNTIETVTFQLTGNASIGATQAGQINKGNLLGAYTMTKVGAGELQLGPAITNTTWTAIVVSNGLLKIAGPITNLSGGTTAPITVMTNATLRVTATSGRYDGTVTIQSGGKLEGTGTINGIVNVDGDLAPGVGSTIPGILTINNSLTLTSGSSTTVQVAASTSDQVAGLTGVTYAGTLNVTDISAGTMTAGQTFQLFNMGGSGNFSSIVGTPSIGGTWSFNPASGVLSHVP